MWEHNPLGIASGAWSVTDGGKRVFAHHWIVLETISSRLTHLFHAYHLVPQCLQLFLLVLVDRFLLLEIHDGFEGRLFGVLKHTLGHVCWDEQCFRLGLMQNVGHGVCPQCIVNGSTGYSITVGSHVCHQPFLTGATINTYYFKPLPNITQFQVYHSWAYFLHNATHLSVSLLQVRPTSGLFGPGA